MKNGFKVLIFVTCVVKLNLAKSSNGPQEHRPSRQAAKGGITAYDQRQTGKYNIHLNIKDVQLISLKGDRFGTGVGVSIFVF